MKRFLSLCFILFSTPFVSYGSSLSNIEYKSPRMGLIQEFGMLQSGLYENFFTDDWVDHFGAYWLQEVVIDNRLHFTVGLGGLFQFPKEEEAGGGWNGDGNSLTKFFFVGPAQADFLYHITPKENEGSLWFRMGLFPFKYNSDASNLGEYLFRSNPYPNYILTGVYSILNNAATQLQGTQLHYEKGGLSLDALLLTETTIAPLYDASLALLANYETSNKFLSIGLGVNFKRLLTIKSERSTPKSNSNAYVQSSGTYYTLNGNYYQNQQDFWEQSYDNTQNVEDSLKAKEFENSVTVVSNLVNQYDSLTAFIDTVTDATQKQTAEASLSALPKREHYTASGTIVMAKVSLDPKVYLSTDVFGEQDLKLYAEAALLGVKDYPVFYDNKLERMPIMVGFNVPTFKLLDLLSVQVEYFNSPFINSFETVLLENEPLPYFPSGRDEKYSTSSYNDITESDNWKWSVLLKKSVHKNIHLSAQFARDHLRMVSSRVWAGPKLEAQEQLLRNKDWYWAMQLSIGI